MAIIPVSIQTLALILTAFLAIKLMFLFIKPKVWLSIAEKFYAKPMVTSVVAVILAYFVLDILLSSGITYVQIFAVTLFVTFLMVASVSVYSNEMLTIGKKILKTKDFWKKAWFPIAIWVILAIMTLNEIYSFW